MLAGIQLFEDDRRDEAFVLLPLLVPPSSCAKNVMPQLDPVIAIIGEHRCFYLDSSRFSETLPARGQLLFFVQPELTEL